MTTAVLETLRHLRKREETRKDVDWRAELASWPDEWREEWAERAAIMEIEARNPRPEAEIMAFEAVKKNKERDEETTT